MNFNMKIFNLKKNKKDKGFVILFAVILVSIILSVSIGLSDIVYKELSFGTQAHNTGEAFLAADTGAECALLYEFKGSFITSNNASIYGYPTTDDEPLNVECAGSNISLNLNENGLYSSTGPWVFYLPNLGSTGKACAKVQVTKTGGSTNIISKGYSKGGDTTNCYSVDPNTVEREIEINL